MSLSLYLHLPFCRSKCPYCDFTSRPGSEAERAAYFEALRAEVRAAGRPWEARSVSTVYLGGGTPTVYAAEELAELVGAVRAAFAVAPEAEITCEANPGTVDEASLRALREAGVNRLSLGVQSLRDDELRRLGRIHTADEAREAIAAARAAGLANLCVDLMYGLPGQRVDEWLLTLAEVVSLHPEHVSAYCLTIEEGTELARQVEASRVVPLDDNAQAEQFEATDAALEAAGYEHYEISNFALLPPVAEPFVGTPTGHDAVGSAAEPSESRPMAAPTRSPCRCRHNLAYWTGAEFVGLGAGAWSYAGGERWGNGRDVSEYVRRMTSGESPAAEREQLPPERAAAEAIMLALRTTDGADLSAIAARHGVEAAPFQAIAERLVGQGLLQHAGGRVAPTKAGMRLGNDVALAFL